MAMFLTSAVAMPTAVAAGDDQDAERNRRAANGGKAATRRNATAESVTAGQIAKSPTTYVGRTVRVTSEVEDVYGRKAFTLDEEEAFAGPDVLVLSPETVPVEIEDKKVTVSGRVRSLVKVDFERDYEWFDADAFGDPDLLARFETRPVLVAESIRSADGKEIVVIGGAARREDAQ